MSQGKLHIKDLVCGYRGPVVSAGDFTFLPGTCTGIFGDNGSGKSTLLRTLAGLQNALAGEIRFRERRLEDHSASEKARIISYLTSQSPAPHGLTGHQVVAMGRLPYMGFFAKLREADKVKIHAAQAMTDMGHLADKRMSEMSDGERKRVMIAQCLAQDTEVILLDEPFAFLDARAKNAIHRLLVRIAREQEKTILLSTHEIGISPPLLDRCLLIDNGKLIETDAIGIARHFT